MSGKDVLKLILLSYGFNQNLKVVTYRGDYGVTGYEVSAENHDISGNGEICYYHEIDCEGLMFHIYEIASFMEKHEIKVKIMSSSNSIKSICNMSVEELSKVN